MTEQEKTILTIGWLNNKFDLLIKKTTGQFDLWDAQDDKRIIEFKFRNKYYKEKYIQVDKFYALLMASEYHNKDSYYIVVDNEVRIFNLTQIKNKLINSKIIIKQAPYQTEFKNNQKINKYFYILNQSNQTNQL
jgi:hypothetical protein|tara:strand:+ start:167 stop:568 length:402 start_codon:yes stop_codon:yes gene_type:complete